MPKLRWALTETLIRVLSCNGPKAGSSGIATPHHDQAVVCSSAKQLPAATPGGDDGKQPYLPLRSNMQSTSRAIATTATQNSVKNQAVLLTLAERDARPPGRRARCSRSWSGYSPPASSASRSYRSGRRHAGSSRLCSAYERPRRGSSSRQLLPTPERGFMLRAERRRTASRAPSSPSG